MPEETEIQHVLLQISRGDISIDEQGKGRKKSQ